MKNNKKVTYEINGFWLALSVMVVCATIILVSLILTGNAGLINW